MLIAVRNPLHKGKKFHVEYLARLKASPSRHIKASFVTLKQAAKRPVLGENRSIQRQVLAELFRSRWNSELQCRTASARASDQGGLLRDNQLA
jgi:hypothetical protein